MKHVLVIGAGLAGAAAASALGQNGFRVTLLEARDRVGGRAFSKHFAGQAHDQPVLEFGGSWITPWHKRIRELVQRHGLSLRARHPVINRLWVKDGSGQEQSPISSREARHHERALARIATDAALYKKGYTTDEIGRPLVGITYRDYMERLNPPQATGDIMNAWWTVSGSGAHDVVAASEFLGSCAYGDGLAEAMIDVWSDTVSPGMAALAERLIARSGAELHLQTAIVAVEQSDTQVKVTTQAGQVFAASHVILALGINQMQDISFSPELRKPMREAVAHGHAGRAFKVWIKARGVSVGTLASGDSTGIELLFAERMADDGSTLLIGFGLDQNGVQPGNSAWVKQQLEKLLPNAAFIASDWHDWCADPYARGTWVSAPAHLVESFNAENWLPIGRVAFASSDYASDQAGWFEGAVIAGETAAESVMRRA